MTAATGSLILLTALFGLACTERVGVTFPTQPVGPSLPPAPPGPPATISAHTSTTQSGVVGTPTWQPPRITVFDVNNRLLQGISISCTVVSGGGSVLQPTSTTDHQGIATCGAWTLGLELGENTLAVAVAGIPPLTFSATAHDATYFDSYDLQTIGGLPVPRQYAVGAVSSGRMRFAPDSTFDQLMVYVDRFGELQPYLLHGRYQRSAEFVRLYEFYGEHPFALGRIAGNLLIVNYLFEEAGEEEVYKKID